MITCPSRSRNRTDTSGPGAVVQDPILFVLPPAAPPSSSRTYAGGRRGKRAGGSRCGDGLGGSAGASTRVRREDRGELPLAASALARAALCSLPCSGFATASRARNLACAAAASSAPLASAATIRSAMRLASASARLCASREYRTARASAAVIFSPSAATTAFDLANSALAALANRASLAAVRSASRASLAAWGRRGEEAASSYQGGKGCRRQSPRCTRSSQRRHRAWGSGGGAHLTHLATRVG